MKLPSTRIQEVIMDHFGPISGKSAARDSKWLAKFGIADIEKMYSSGEGGIILRAINEAGVKLGGEQ